MNHTSLIGTDLLSECQKVYGAGIMMGDGLVDTRWTKKRSTLDAIMFGDRCMNGDGRQTGTGAPLMNLGIMMGDGIAMNGDGDTATGTDPAGEDDKSRVR